MHNLTKITDHAERIVRRMWTQYRTGGDVEQLIRFIGSLFQEIEDLFWDIMIKRALDVAEGATLDAFGMQLNLPRPVTGLSPATDATYRVFIFARISEIMSHGTLPDIYNILNALGLADAAVMPTFPAAAVINYQENGNTLTCACMRKIIESGTPPVSLDFVAHSSQPFGFLGDTEAFGFGVGELGGTA